MSNSQVGTVFERVIVEVCDNSQVDFEEGGVDQQTLEDLKKGWRKKLSSLGVAEFPWDPAPAPQPQQTPQPQPQPQPQQQPQQQQQQQQPAEQQPMVPSVALPSTMPPLPGMQGTPAMTPMSQPAGNTIVHTPQTPVATVPEAQVSQQIPVKAQPAVQVKQEPVYAQPPPQAVPQHVPNVPQNASAATIAQQRAANALQQRYGAAAAHQVQSLQTQSPQAPTYATTTTQQPSQASVGATASPIGVPTTLPNGTSQLQPTSIPHYAQPPVPGPRPSLPNTQTDGAGDGDALQDWKAEVARRREAAKEQNGAGDRMIREYIESRGLALEGGGLMRPLPEIVRDNSKAKVQVKEPVAEDEAATSDETTAAHQRAPARYDGADDEDDDDAINSDLDDPEDALDDEDADGEAVGQVMLCTYDKVQRVKSKWKCTLKDGILSCGGKEYVFHKGQGEFEWY